MVRLYLSPSDTERFYLVERIGGNAYYAGVVTDSNERVDNAEMQARVRGIFPYGFTVDFADWYSWIQLVGAETDWAAVVVSYTDWQDVVD
jgi:hypothetical protein